MRAYRNKMSISKSQALALASVGVVEHEGYTGVFTRSNAPNAIPAGTKIRKVRAESGDRHQIGAVGTVLGSINVNDLGIMYFIEWDDSPKTAVSVIAWKVNAL